MRQNGIFYSGDKFHPFPLRSIDFFQIPCDTENFLFQKLLLLKKFFYARKIPRFFRKYFCVFLNLFLAHRLRLNFWFFLRTRNATKRQRRQDNGNDNWIFPQTYTVAKKHRDQYAKRLQDRAKPATPPRQPTRNAKFCQNSYVLPSLALHLSDWKIKNRVLWNDLPAPEFGSEIVLWTFSHRAANALRAMTVWPRPKFTSGNTNGNAHGTLCRIWNNTKKRHCILELESGDKILPAEAAAIALKSYAPRARGCAWLPFGLQLGRIQVALEPCLGCVWAVIGPWLGQWFALGMRLSCAWSAFGSRSDRVWVAFGNIRVVFR